MMPDKMTKPVNTGFRRKRAEKMQRVAELVQSNPELPIRQLAEQAGVSKTTAQAYLAKWGINKGELDVFVENRNSIVKSKQEEILRALTPDKLQKATAKDLTVAYGIMLDKDRLESGESTSNVASWTRVVSDSQAKVIDGEIVDR